PRRLPASDSVQQSDRVPAARTARDLSRADDCRVVGSISKVGDSADVPVQLGRPPDSPRVKEVETRSVAAEEAVEVAEIEGVAAGNEERPLFLIVRLVGGEIDCRRIDLDLPKVRI